MRRIEDDIYDVSWPFAAGTLAGWGLIGAGSDVVLAAVGRGGRTAAEAQNGSGLLYVYQEYWAAGVITAIVAVTVWAIRRQLIPERYRKRPALWWCLFFLLGISCFAVHSVIGPGAGFSTARAGECPGAGVAANAPYRFAAKLQTWNVHCRGVIDSIPFHEQENTALVRALLLGDRSGLSKECVHTFRAAGAAHLLALSGMHLGIVYALLSRLLWTIGRSIFARKLRSFLTITACGAYTLLCGSGPSLVRAWLFIALREGGYMLDRRQPPEQILCSALTLHLIFRPDAITTIGFQLSYLAMVGIVFIWPRVRGWMDNSEVAADEDGQFTSGSGVGRAGSDGSGLGGKLWQGLSLSICCQLFTAPLTLLYFGTFPKFFMLTNLLAAPLMTVVMICGLIAFAISALGLPFPAYLLSGLEFPITCLRRLLAAIAAIS